MLKVQEPPYERPQRKKVVIQRNSDHEIYQISLRRTSSKTKNKNPGERGEEYKVDTGPNTGDDEKMFWSGMETEASK